MAKFPTRLMLTSPTRKGKVVILAQKVLNGSNRLKKDFLKSEVDGEWGPLSQQATRNAQYWLGYPKRAINGVYGPTIHSFLVPLGRSNAKALPKSYRLRRRARLRKAAILRKREAKRNAAVAVAKTQIGITESPAGSNSVKFSNWYGMRGPWCAMFVSWCWDQVGVKFRYAYCPYIEDDARAGRNGLSLIGSAKVKAGDVALFHFGSGIAKHVGIVEKINRRTGTVTCIEGNTSSGDGGSQDNGGGVYRRVRPMSHVRHFVRVKLS